MDGLPPTPSNLPRIALLSLVEGASRDLDLLTGGAEGFDDTRAEPGRSAVQWLALDIRLPDGARQKQAIRTCVEAGFDVLVVVREGEREVLGRLAELCAPLRRPEVAGTSGSARAPVRKASALGARAGRVAEFGLMSAARAFVPALTPADARFAARAYDVAKLARIPFERNADDARFDAQLLLQLRAAGYRVEEVALALGEPRESAAGLDQARELLRSAFGFKLHELGLASDARFELPAVYSMKESARSSHATLLGMVGTAPRRILDVGCGQGQLGSILRERGHHVTGIDMYPPKFELDAFIEADLAQGLPIPADLRFDVIVLADVLEHMAEPLPFLRSVVEHVSEGGMLLVSLPNAVHWSVRGQVALGRFEYTNKGLLDRGHLRFFTRASAKRLFASAGLVVRGERTTPVPWENVFPAALRSNVARGIENVDHTLAGLWPNLFAYQHVFALERARQAAGH